MKIKLLVTGGTIDKQYNELTERLAHTRTHIPKMLAQGRSRVNLEVEQLMLIDSLEMNENHRQAILRHCQAADTDKIVITHGTGTIVKTAVALGQNIEDKTIVLVGSMIPYVLKGSDALFNFGAAITAVQILGHGVFIAMNGKIFNWDDVVKNEIIGEFQTKSLSESRSVPR